MSKKFFSILVLSAVICSVGVIGSAQAVSPCPVIHDKSACNGNHNCQWKCLSATETGKCCVEHTAVPGAIPAPGLILVPLQAPAPR